MKKYKAVIFDFDGTLANTYEGIFNSYAYAAKMLGLPEPTNELVDGAIGAPLLEAFQSRFHMDEEQAIRAVGIYRERYSQKGIYEVQLYDGMLELLYFLKQNNFLVGVATLKLEDFAVKMIHHMKIENYFDGIKGINLMNTLTKSQILNQCIETLNLSNTEVVLIGDSAYDAVGAEEAGVDFIAVTYGFGFKSTADAQQYKNIYVAESCKDIMSYVGLQK